MLVALQQAVGGVMPKAEEILELSNFARTEKSYK
jgi:hypothetical protein